MKFRKKPIEIEARRVLLTEDIHTLEGIMRAEPGDWIITGIKGEQYPCKPDIFAHTYEPADEEGMRAWAEAYNFDGTPLAHVAEVADAQV